MAYGFDDRLPGQDGLMRRRVLDLRVGDRFVWSDPLSPERMILTVRSGPVNYFGSVAVEVEEWDFDFEAIEATVVEIVSSASPE